MCWILPTIEFPERFDRGWRKVWSYLPQEEPKPLATGWLCPRCGASNGPQVAKCDCQPPTVTTTGQPE